MKGKRATFVVIAAGTLLVATALVASAGPSEQGWHGDQAVPGDQAGQAPTPVSSCTTIDTPGTYELTTDLAGSSQTCIAITASDVVFDGAGHAVTGTGGATGVEVAGNATLVNVTVRDVTVADWGQGVLVEDLHDGAVRGVNASSNVAGITVTTGSLGVTVADSVVTANARTGIRVRQGSVATTVTKTRVATNGVGISIAGDSNSTDVLDTHVESNVDEGVRVADTAGTVLANVTVLDSGTWDLHATGYGTVTATDLELASATVDLAGQAVALRRVTAPPAPPSGMDDVGAHVEATDTGAGASLQLNVSYASAVGVDESSLRVWRHDGAWGQVPAPNAVDAGANFVNASVTNFAGPPAVFAPLGNATTGPGTPTPTATTTPTSSPTVTPTATPTPTGTQTQTPTPTSTPTSTPTTTAVPTPTATPVTPFTSTPTPTPSPTPTATATQSPVTPLTATPTPVDDCRVIDQPGSYVLTQDLVDRPEEVCIDIRSDGVVFDGDGHTIDADGATSISGVQVDGDAWGSNPSATVTVRDVETSDWHNGFYYVDVDGGTLTGVTARDNEYCVEVALSSNITVTDVEALRCGSGTEWGASGSSIAVQLSDRVTVADASVDPDGQGGTTLAVANGQNVTLTNVTVPAAGIEGLHVNDVGNVTVRNVSIDSPFYNGIFVENSNGVRVFDAVVNGTGEDGVRVHQSDDTSVENVTTSNVSGRALWVEDSTNATARTFTLGTDTTPTTVDAVGDSYGLEMVGSPPADPASERNVSRFVRVRGSGWVLVNVSYGPLDLALADVGESTLATWLHDGSWSQASGTAGVNAVDDYAYVNVTNPSGQVVAPLGAPGTGSTVSVGSGAGFGASVAVVALVALAVGALGVCVLGRQGRGR